jgi:hypothetical protein
VSEISKTMGTQMPTMKKRKERKEIAHALWQKFLSSKQERHVLRSIVELG